MDISLLRKYLTQLNKKMRQEGRNSPETWTRMLVLSSIDRHGELATPSVIAKAEAMQSSNLAATLRELEHAALIVRAPDPSDRRKTLLRLSEQGVALLEESRARRDAWLETTISETLTESEQLQLEAILPVLEKLIISDIHRVD